MTVSGLALKVRSLCMERGWTLAVAESCTGGLAGGNITTVPGSSEYFLGGVIAYSNKIKTGVLGVPPDLLGKYGAVSSEVALKMAEGVRGLTGADVGIAVTGVAGPAGSEAKHPGMVHIAVISPTFTVVREYSFAGGREMIRKRAVDAALELLSHAALDEQ